MKKAKTFKSTFRTKLTADIDVSGKNIILKRDLVFYDKNRKRWCAPKGANANGASYDSDTKRYKWRGRLIMFFMGSRLMGFWAWATVLHDFYCDHGEALGISSQAVHDMFLEAMLVCIDMIRFTPKERRKAIRKAKLFHWSVSKKGPKFNRGNK